ncbi:MAG: tetratricopeptide repeat protein [Phycisphaerales bacterium]
MTNESTKTELEGSEAEAAHSESPDFRQLWQIPAAILAIGLLGVGLVMLLATRPPDEIDESLVQIESALDAGRYEDAMSLVGDLELHEEKFVAEQRARYRALRGDAYYSLQMTADGNAETNLPQVILNYELAEESGGVLTPARIYRAADSLISLDRIDEAFRFFDRLPASDHDRRHRLLKRLIERNLASTDMNFEDAFALLNRFLNDENLSAADRVWGISRRAELQLEQGYPEEAVESLLVSIQRLRAGGASEGDLAELYLLIGRGYYDQGHMDDAVRMLERARQLVPRSSPLHAAILLRLGQIAQSQNTVERAFNLFDLVARDFPGAPSHLPALVGRADAYAFLGDFENARRDYIEVVKALDLLRQRNAERRDTPRELVMNSLLGWHDRLVELSRHEEALEFAKLAENLYPVLASRVHDVPEPILSRIADTNWALAEASLNEAFRLAGEPTDADRSEYLAIEYDRLDPGTKIDLQSRYLQAGEYFEAFARARQIDDPDGAAESLWAAAESFDKAGDQIRAIAVLKEFIRLSENHPRQLKGIYRLGRCYQASADYEGAIKQFERLVESDVHRFSPEAYRSYVPLALAHLNHPDHPNAGEAERLLRSVVEGEARLDPEAVEFRDAMLLLGTLYSQAEEHNLPNAVPSYYPLAIERLTYVIEAYPDDETFGAQLNHARYRRAHAHRLAAEAIDDRLGEEMPSHERQSLLDQRKQHLVAAEADFHDAIQGYESIPARKRNPLERESHKAADFWYANTVFELGEYDRAVTLYGSIADQYPNDPSSLIAMVQITNAYAAKGDFAAARAARNRARRKLLEFPDSSFDTGLLPLNSEAWERLLEWDPILDETASAAGAP